jgi:hypothetical protein
MTSVVSDLLGKRVSVRFRRWESTHWQSCVTGCVRGVAQSSETAFSILLEVEIPLAGDTHTLYLFGMQEVPARALVAFTTAPGVYCDGQVAFVVEGGGDASPPRA